MTKMPSQSEPVPPPSHLPVLRDAVQRDLAVYDPYLNPQLPDDEIDLREIWRIVSKYRWTIIMFTVLVVITVGIANAMMRPVFKATTSIEIAPDSSIVKLENVDQEQQASYREIAQTQENIIRSESVAVAVMDKLDLWNDPELSGEITQRGVMNGLNRLKALITGKDGLFAQWQAEAEGETASSTQALSEEEIQRREALERFHERLIVEPVRNSYLFRISFESFGRNVAANVANAVVEEYQRLSGKRRLESTAGARVFLEEQIAEVQARLETSEKELTAFARKNQIVDLEDRNNILDVRLTELNNQLTAVQGERIQAQTLYRQAQAGDIESMPAVLDRSLIDELKNEYVTLEAEYFRLSQIFKDTYPKVKQIKAQMQQVKDALDAETNKVVRSLRLEYNQLADKERLIKAALEEQKAELLNLKDRAVQYNILKREWETNRELYSGLLEKMKEVGVAAGIERSNVSVVDHAAVPVQPDSPRKSRNVALAGVIGLFGGFGIAFLLAYLDNTFRLTEEMERALHVPSLGIIPKIGDRKLPDRNTLGMLAATDRTHELSEAVRTVRTSLRFSTAGGAPKRLLVTSATAGEGKSTFAANLAITMAQNSQHVLLVNADLRRPVLHDILQVPSEPGLSDYLVGAERQVRYRTAVEGLEVIPCGVLPPHPTELVGSAQMDHLLSEMAEEFDHIIVEAPPILGLADSLVLSAHVDGVVLMVASGVTSKDAVRDAVKRLRGVHAPLLGTVLNMVDTRSHEYGYYNRYYYNDTKKHKRRGRKRNAQAA
ncbi:MAG: hypothetical protein DWQ08_11655 [Proteobacteria bacterium]|nr:MAG: hypothetical protein DWQ08_11655 [Pseudomonadota bacterium]